MRQIVMAHWTDGGTGLTNFSKQDFPVYVETVRRFGNPDYVVVEQEFGHNGDGGSLHRFCTGDASDFWRLFDRVKKELHEQAA